jgi:hypothetical protein
MARTMPMQRAGRNMWARYRVSVAADVLNFSGAHRAHFSLIWRDFRGEAVMFKMRQAVEIVKFRDGP